VIGELLGYFLFQSDFVGFGGLLFCHARSLLVVELKPAIDLDAAKTNQSSGALRALSTRRIKEK